MSPLSRMYVAATFLIVLAGCSKPASPGSGSGSGTTTSTTPGIYGRVTAEGQGVGSSTLNLYAVGSSSDGGPATSILNTAVTTDNAGNFNLLNKFACPSQTTQVVLVATGGNPGDSAAPNSALALMLAIGPCSQLSTSSYFLVNETNTVAAVATLAPFITSPSAIGSSGADAASLIAGMVTARQFVNIGNGVSPGDTPPTGDYVPSQLINTLASVIGTCTPTTGGTAGDGSRCGLLFTLATPPGGTAPINTLAALLNIAANPTLNTVALFNVGAANPFFQPVVVTAPYGFNTQMIQPSAPTLSPAAGLTFNSTARGVSSAAQSITFANTTSATMSLGSPSILGASSAAFTLSSGCNATLAPQSTCTVGVTFKPIVSGATSAYILVSSGSANVQMIPLSGSAA